jgi:methyl-accepting chemotaxis protein
LYFDKNQLMKGAEVMKFGFRFNSIRTQITSSVVMIIAVVCIGLTAAAYFIIAAGVRASTDDSMQKLVEQGANVLSSRVYHHFSVLNSLARVRLFQDMRRNQAEIMTLFGQVAADNGYFDMTVVDTNAIGFNNNVKYVQLPKREYLMKAFQGKDSMSDPLISKAPGTMGKLIVIQAVPVKNGQNQVIGAIALSREGNSLSDLVSDITYGKSGKAFMVNKQGTFIANQDRQKVINAENIIEASKKDSEFQSMAAVIQKMADTKKGLEEYRYQGTDNYIAYHPVPGTDWTMGLTAPKNEVFASLNRMRNIIAVFSLIFLAIGGVISYLVAHQIGTPIRDMVNVVNLVAMGNLTKTVKFEGKRGFFKGSKEFSQLVDGFNHAISSLRNLITHLDEQAQTLAMASKELKNASNESGRSAAEVAKAVECMAKASQEQTIQINETVNNVTELGNLVSIVSHDSLRIADASKQVAASAQNGQRVSTDVVSDIGAIYNITKEISSIIQEINQSSERIRNISSLIEGFAGQTTLLALNAAIEAARAGEHGRGFSVVAMETGKLAEQSKQSSVEISSVIMEMINRSTHAVKTIQKGVSQFEASETLTTEAAFTFGNIFKQLDGTLTQIQEVALSAQKMAEHNDQVINTITSVAAINEESLATAEEISASAQQQSASAEEVAALANNLSEIVDAMKIAVTKFTI